MSGASQPELSGGRHRLRREPLLLMVRRCASGRPEGCADAGCPLSSLGLKNDHSHPPSSEQGRCIGPFTFASVFALTAPHPHPVRQGVLLSPVLQMGKLRPRVPRSWLVA